MPQRNITTYLLKDQQADVTFADFEECPATSFLKQSVHLWDSMQYCKRHFPKNNDGNYRTDGVDSLNRIACAIHASIMGHFETYQRTLFAGLFELSLELPMFNMDRCTRLIDQNSNFEFTAKSFARYRYSDAAAGRMLADSLSGWHNPQKVNMYFDAISGRRQFYSNANATLLRTLWQVRHSIVHTGGWLTSPDAQKIRDLEPFADQPIVVKDTFVDNVVRRLHVLVKQATGNVLAGIKQDYPNMADEVTDLFHDFCRVQSPRNAWLNP